MVVVGRRVWAVLRDANGLPNKMTRRTDEQIADAIEQHLRAFSPWQPLPRTRLALAIGASVPRVARVLNADPGRFRSVRCDRTGRYTWHLQRWRTRGNRSSG